MIFENIGTEEDPPVQTTYGDRIRFAIALLLAPLIGVLGAFLLIALKLQ